MKKRPIQAIVMQSAAWENITVMRVTMRKPDIGTNELPIGVTEEQCGCKVFFAPQKNMGCIMIGKHFNISNSRQKQVLDGECIIWLVAMKLESAFRKISS